MLTAAISDYLKLRKSQWWSSEDLMDLQWRRAEALIAHAYENVLFYRNKFDKAGIKPGDIRGPADLPLIPPCAKEELREAGISGWAAKNYRLSDCVEAVTSGSTGAPLKFYIDKRSLAFRMALNLRTLEFSTYRLGNKLFQVSPPLSGKLGAGVKTRLIDTLLRRMTVSPFELDINNKLRQLTDYKPHAIVGYTSYIKSLADLAQGASSSPQIPSIMTTSEKLLAGTRQKLSEVFGGRVFDQYGSVETGRSASECVGGPGYHINVEGVLIEIVNEAGQPVKAGETGEVLVTNLMNYANLFIRYKTGDSAVLSVNQQCACGRKLPMLDRIEGRLNDIILTPDGRRILPEYFYLSLREIEGLAQFQINQDSPGSLRIFYMRDQNFNEGKRSQVEQEYRQYLSGMRVTWEPVEHIDKIAGKHRHIISWKQGS